MSANKIHREKKMKDKIIPRKGMLFLFVLFITISIFMINLNVSMAQVWNSCPFGLENDPYPGECGRYIDTNQDNICDLSQPEPTEESSKPNEEIKKDDSSQKSTVTFPEEEYSVEIPGSRMKTMTIDEIAQLWGIDANQLLNTLKEDLLLKMDYSINNTVDDLRAEVRFSPSIIKGVAENLKKQKSPQSEDPDLTDESNDAGSEAVKEQVISSESQAEPTTQKKIISDYNFIEISILTLLFYLGGKWLAARFKISSAKEKKFWNILLLFSFIASAGTGFILVMIRDFDWFRSINFNFLYWHVEYSIVMGFIGIFHALWHVKYYVKTFSKRR